MKVHGYPNDPIEDFRFNRLDIQAQTAGTITDARDWTFTSNRHQNRRPKPRLLRKLPQYQRTFHQMASRFS